MSITKSINRPKLNGTLAENIVWSAQLNEVDSGGYFAIDLIATVTLDAGGTASKTVFRHELTPQLVNTIAYFTNNTIAFPGTATNYATGGVTPPDSQGTVGVTSVDMNVFLAAAGDAQKNT